MNRLAVFARRPEPGRVKTRLSPALPTPLAAALYAAMLADAFAAGAAAAAGERCAYWSDGAGQTPAGWRACAQRGADLGARLAAAFAELLAAPGDRAVIVGSDCPALAPTLLDAAFAALAHADLVLAPARDGGYGLIGLARTAPALFEGVAWSTDRVLAQTRERAGALGLRVELLPPLDDLDTPDDLARLVGALAAGRGDACGPAMRAALGGIGLAP
ncbi:MAG TPA: TIGR04282 family arsenosugar biosynthesis glycosyltransferase [Candidatus Eisenbacteria bacterium]|nr:TIGR04282 family arsenosugar biosynthesis glycosyltransferase [Candidatus Eisenbacteria bacterium]